MKITLLAQAIGRIQECSTWHATQAAATKANLPSIKAPLMVRAFTALQVQHELWAKELQRAIAEIREGGKQ